MSLGTSNRDGGKTSEAGHLRAIYQGFHGEVLTGLAVSQRGAGANMSVDIAIGDAIIPRSDATYGHPAFNDAVYNLAISGADPSNPRRDIVVMYVDYGVTPSTGVSNNTNGVVAVKVVAGTPAGSPADPTDSAIQSSVGASNPYIKLARVRVGAGVTSIGNSVIDDLRTLAHAHTSGGWKPLSAAWDTVAYSAWDSTNKLATLVVPDSTIFTLGQKFRYWQLTGGWKYGFIVKAPSSTSIIVYHGTDYTLNNERIYLPAYSREKAPDGFPIDPAKWTVSYSDTSTRTQNTPTSGTYYNINSASVTAPIGTWYPYAQAYVVASLNAAGNLVSGIALSTANNSASDNDLASEHRIGAVSSSFSVTHRVGGSGRTITVASATPYYLNTYMSYSGTSTSMTNSGAVVTTIIRFVCGYL